MTAHNETGQKGEDFAALFLKRKGYRLVGRNVRNKFGEIDLIALDGDTMVFVEVKTRSSNLFGNPYEAVRYDKMKRLSRAAVCYLRDSRWSDRRARFDVLSVIIKNGRPECEHIIDAFDLVE